ncbi:DUF6597 domain-containing transcriptional factor [Hymenobacter volaticus]|uniref:DUF6597 domain-containing protein n=1 Tax=Hymenobacter volaticus TaxID=2932254 RepID=A0ABY4GAV5_9BACT|nr:DUF6597 domain-containing transcriptional factor [Hymenobacter volaticus]UOQ68038.1 hypothetical protein MUN86_09395 [Hymenobacter volaticus]
MHVQQFAPPDYLKEYVRYFWLLESAGDKAEPKTFRMIADGYPGLIFQQPDYPLFQDHMHTQWPRAFVYGQTTTSGNIYAPSSFKTLGVYFHPSALTAVFGFDADELTNSCLDLNLLTAPLCEQLVNTEPIGKQIELLSSFLFALIQKNKAVVSQDIQYSLRLMRSTGGELPC